MRRLKVDKEILPILEDYHLFLDGDKYVKMPFRINKVDKNHITSLKGESTLTASAPFGNTTLECEVREHNEFNYSFKILSDAIKSRLLFRLDEGSKTHWNRHLPIPIDQQQVPPPHFHKIGDDGIMLAYSNDHLFSRQTPLNIHEGFIALCEECHIKDDHIQIDIQEEGTLPLQFDSDADPLKDVIFP